MNKDTNTITIDEVRYTNATFIKNEYGINSDRLTKWRQGRGQTKNHPLRYIKLPGIYGHLYCVEDIEILQILTNKSISKRIKNKIEII